MQAIIRFIRNLVDGLKYLWGKIPEKVQSEIISVGHTMAAAVFVEASTFFAQYDYLPPWDKTVALALCLALVRSAIKAGLTFFFSRKK